MPNRGKSGEKAGGRVPSLGRIGWSGAGPEVGLGGEARVCLVSFSGSVLPNKLSISLPDYFSQCSLSASDPHLPSTACRPHTSPYSSPPLATPIHHEHLRRRPRSISLFQSYRSGGHGPCSAPGQSQRHVAADPRLRSPLTRLPSLGSALPGHILPCGVVLSEHDWLQSRSTPRHADRAHPNNHQLLLGAPRNRPEASEQYSQERQR